MITLKFQITLIIAVVIYLLILYRMLQKRVVLLKYTLLWLLTGVVFLLLAIFPRSLMFFANLVGVYADIYFLFAALIAFIGMITFSLTHIVSKQNDTTKRLVQEISILEKRVEDLEKRLEESGK